jgi:pyruvate formate lyase activating enzyme
MTASAQPTVTGRVFDVSKGRIDDGPGLRTVVFLKGCRLDCPWCHNPEGIGSFVQLSFSAQKCISCGLCQQACHRDWPLGGDAWRDGCELTGACVEVCPTKARKLVGRDVTPQEIVDKVLADRDFFSGTGGGVTFSGGEPMLQADFVFETAALLRAAGVHVAVETGGFWSPEHVVPLAGAADLVLYDLKHVNVEKLKSVLVQGSPLILQNLEALLERDVELQLHLTLVPGFNDAEEDLCEIAAWLGRCGRVPQVRLKPFHRLATAKHELYASTYAYADTEPQMREDVVAASKLMVDLGLNVDMGAI